MFFFLPWLAVAAAIAVLSTAALSLAGSSPPVADGVPEDTMELFVQSAPLVVPDVRFQPYVFAKGILEDAGFAWRVRGGAKGFPANIVVAQKPKPGTLLRDTGAPTIALTLKRNREYEQRGLARKNAPYRGTKNVRWEDSTSVEAPAPAEEPPATDESAEASATQEDPPPGEAAPAEEVLPPTEPLEPLAAPVEPPKPPAAASNGRTPAFEVPGAPPEPPNEIALAARADKLANDVAGQAKTPELVGHWLFQHQWIVTGATFGWHGGEQALVKLIAIDEDLEARWGIGAKSAQVARRALDEVRTETRGAA